MFEEGSSAFSAGDYTRAEEAFEGSYAIHQSFDTAVNLGITEQKLGKEREAAGHFDFATRNFPPSESKENRDRLSKLLADAKSHVVSLRVEADVPGAHVKVNGEDVGTSPLGGEVFAEPGHIVVRAEAAGYAPDQKEIDKAAGLSDQVSLHLVPTDGGSKPIWPAIVIGGVGVVGLGVGIAGFVLSAGASSDADTIAADLASNGTRCNTGCDELQGKLDDVASFRTMGIVGVSVAGAAVIGTIVYLVVPSSSKKADSAIWVAPSLGDRKGVVIGGRF